MLHVTFAMDILVQGDFFTHMSDTSARMARTAGRLEGHLSPTLSLWPLHVASLDFLTAWQSQSSWISYIVAGFLQRTKVELALLP